MRYSYKSTIDDYDDDDTEAHETLRAPRGFDGPIKDGRHCTDILCLLLLAFCWGIMTWIGVYSINHGDYRYILYPLDYDGNVCGTNFSNTDMTEYPYLLYVNIWTGGVCVDQCPSLSNLTSDGLTDMYSLITYDGIWQISDKSKVELDPNFIGVADYSASEDVIQCTDDLCFPNPDSIEDSWTSTGINKGRSYAYYIGDTYELLNRCVLTTAAEKRIQNLTGAVSAEETVLDAALSSIEWLTSVEFGGSSTAFFTNLYADLWTSRFYILGFGFGCSLLVSLIYMVLLRIPCLLTLVVWSSILSIIGLFGVAGYFAYDKAQRWEEEDPPTVSDERIRTTTITSYVLFGIAALLTLIGCCVRSQIQLAIGCVRQAGKAVHSMILILFVPVLQGLTFFVFWVVWGYFSIHLVSLGTITTRSYPVDLQGTEITFRVYEFDDFVEQCIWFLVFCFFWTAAFIVAVGDMIVAMAFSKWYFARNKSLVSSLTVVSSIISTCCYHLGTCAYGSLIIAIIQFLRAILTKIQKEVERATNRCIATCLLCCCQCCLCCLEKCMKFINKNAYIHCAIFGTSFCPAARKSFFLILRNALRIGAVSYVSAAVLMIGKLFISTLTTTASYFFIVEYMEVNLHSFAGPVVLIFIISWFVADMFMDVFEIGILAILHCFVADEEMFGGSPRYAERTLTRWVDKNGAFK